MDQQQALNTTPDWRHNRQSDAQQYLDENTPLPGEVELEQASSSLQRMGSLLGDVDEDRLEQDMARIERSSSRKNMNKLMSNERRKTVENEMRTQIIAGMAGLQRSFTPSSKQLGNVNASRRKQNDMLILEDSKEQEQIQNEMQQEEGYFEYDANEEQQVDLDID